MSNRKKRIRAIKQVIFLAALFVLCGGGVHMYYAAKERGKLIETVFVSPSGRQATYFHLKLARTEAERMRGLQFVKSLGEREGMLFVFPDESRRSFWMKDTYIPLDMIFLDKNRKVVGIKENVKILTTDSQSVESPSMYVVEIAAGSVKRYGIVAGSTAVFDIR